MWFWGVKEIDEIFLGTPLKTTLLPGLKLLRRKVVTAFVALRLGDHLSQEINFRLQLLLPAALGTVGGELQQHQNLQVVIRGSLEK